MPGFRFNHMELTLPDGGHFIDLQAPGGGYKKNAGLPALSCRAIETFSGEGGVLVIDGKKDEFTREWGPPGGETYNKVDPESEKRLIEFVERNAGEKPFFVSYWPNLLNLMPSPEPKQTYNAGMLAEGLVKLDAFIGQLMDKLVELGIE